MIKYILFSHSKRKEGKKKGEEEMLNMSKHCQTYIEIEMLRKEST